MHNSDNAKVSNKCSKYLKRTIITVVFLTVLILGNSILNYLFIPYSYVELDYNNVYKNKYNTIFVGTSHGKCGIDPDIIDEVNGGKSVNICLGGEYLSYTYYRVKDMCSHNKPDKIVYELDPGYWVTDEYIGTDSALIYHNMKLSTAKMGLFFNKLAKEDFRVALFPWYIFRKEYKMISENIKNKSNGLEKRLETSVFTNPAQTYNKNGFIYRNAVNSSLKTWQNFIEWDRSRVNSETLKYFKKLVKYCKKEDIELNVIITPIPKETLDKYKASYDDCNEYFKELMNEYDVEFYNFNVMDLDGVDTTEAAFCDYEGHFIGENAEIFSRKLAEYIK